MEQTTHLIIFILRRRRRRANHSAPLRSIVAFRSLLLLQVRSGQVSATPTPPCLVRCVHRQANHVSAITLTRSSEFCLLLVTSLSTVGSLIQRSCSILPPPLAAAFFFLCFFFSRSSLYIPRINPLPRLQPSTTIADMEWTLYGWDYIVSIFPVSRCRNSWSMLHSNIISISQEEEEEGSSCNPAGCEIAAAWISNSVLSKLSQTTLQMIR